MLLAQVSIFLNILSNKICVVFIFQFKSLHLKHGIYLNTCIHLFLLTLNIIQNLFGESFFQFYALTRLVFFMGSFNESFQEDYMHIRSILKMYQRQFLIKKTNEGNRGTNILMVIKYEMHSFRNGRN